VIRIDNVAELESAVRTLLSKADIGAVVHCMAVSDYRVKAVTTSRSIAENIRKRANEAFSGGVSDEKLCGMITEAVNGAETLADGGKINSDTDDLILLLKKTPKIISLFKKLAPEAVLIGFKLLNNAAYDTLIEAGYSVLERNACDCVLANDLRDIGEGRHIGYLINKNKDVLKLNTKKEIAEAIVSAVASRIR
jgi:phosphopantothenate-cysteine ligase